MESLQAVWDFAREHYILTPVAALFALAVVVPLVRGLSVHVWYIIALAAAALAAWRVDRLLYFWPFALGMATAFAEIISKFSDEPLKALKTWHSLFYHVLNGAVAVFALYFLALATGKPDDFRGVDDMVELQYAVAAGVGAMLLLRSKLFNIKVGEENVSFGPDQMVKIIFKFMESEIDRLRARDRMRFVSKYLTNIHFDKVYDHCVTMFGRAGQVLGDNEKQSCLRELSELKANAKLDVQQKSYHLGFIFLNRMGERFVSDLFDNPLPQFQISARGRGLTSGGVLSGFVAVESENPLLKALPIFGTKEETVPYVAYGPNMSSARVRELLNWAGDPGNADAEKAGARRCKLRDYRVSFNMAPDGSVGGYPNLVSAPGQVAEGVLYRLPKTTLDFLKLREKERGNHPIKVRAVVEEAGGKEKEVEADMLVADADKVGPERPPVKEELNAMIEGAAEFGLSEQYQASLKALTPFTAAAEAVAAMPGANGGAAKPVIMDC